MKRRTWTIVMTLLLAFEPAISLAQQSTAAPTPTPSPVPYPVITQHHPLTGSKGFGDEQTACLGGACMVYVVRCIQMGTTGNAFLLYSILNKYKANMTVSFDLKRGDQVLKSITDVQIAPGEISRAPYGGEVPDTLCSALPTVVVTQLKLSDP